VGKFPTSIPEEIGAFVVRATPARVDYSGVSDSKRNSAVAFRATEHSTIIGRENSRSADVAHRVLATLTTGEKEYRVMGDLLIRHGIPELRLHRFKVPDASEWFAERKIVLLPVPDSTLAPLEQPLKGAEFRLSSPIALDAEAAAALFGPAGPPEV
jgi:hypothetical protein